MDSRVRMWRLIVFSCLVVIAVQHAPGVEALVYRPDFNPPYPKAISDLKEAIVKGFGFQSDDVKISDFNLRDAMVGKSVQYEFDIEIDNKILPFKLLEDVSRWDYVELPIFQTEPRFGPDEESGLAERKLTDDQTPVLAPFQLAGPMELWIQDAKDMRISLPNDVDAGELRKVILADGAVVTVKGARSVSLRHPIELPLPLNRSTSGFASGLLALADHLRNTVRTKNGPLVSLRIVGPTSLNSPASTTSSSTNRLKLKRLAPGLVELSSASKRGVMEAEAEVASAVDLQSGATALLTPDRFSTLWPITSINGANTRLLGFEALLTSVLGSRANEEGSFKLTKADVSAQTFVKIGFAVEKKVKQSDLVGFPEWRTRPQNIRMHFEVLAKVDGNKVVPERVFPVEPVIAEDSFTPDALVGNISMSKVPIVHQPPNPFTL